MKNIFYDKSKIDYGNLLFPRRALWMLLIPLIIEQMLNSLMGMVDTLMVSRVGAEAISAVSLVDSINNLVLQVLRRWQQVRQSSAHNIWDEKMKKAVMMLPNRLCLP